MNANVFIVGAQSRASESLFDAARRAGFFSIKSFTSLSEVEKALSIMPNCFFFFAPVPDITLVADVVRHLRKCKRRDVRFSPLIYFSEASSREIIRGCITLGFDDVVAMPFSQPYLEERLKRQMNMPLAYAESPNYFGPVRPGKPVQMGTADNIVVRFQRNPVEGIVLDSASKLSAA